MTLARPTHLLHATVLGAGTMGAQIAAHLANAGLRVALLDLPAPKTSPKDKAAARNAVAMGAMKALLKSKPAALMDARNVDKIRPGNLEDDLEAAVAKSDLVIEAVIERLDVKQPLFERIAAAAPAHAILATNTSGLPVTQVAEKLPPAARARVVGMHFFNPPRYMHLLEVVPGADTSEAVIAEVTRFSRDVLGKGVVRCRDTPSFIANRIGIVEMNQTFAIAFAQGYRPEEVDLLNGPLMGRPRTGSFRLLDLVGLDVSALVTEHLRSATSDDPKAANYDELRDTLTIPAAFTRMIAAGKRGDKTGEGIYKKVKGAGGKSEILVIDFATLEYGPTQAAEFPELAEVAKIPDLTKRAAAALRSPGRAGEFLRALYLPVFNYCANRLGTICDSPKSIDEAMMWGYGWKLGPFALWDAVGLQWTLDEMKKAGITPSPTLTALVAKAGAEATWYGGTPAAPTVYLPALGLHQPIDPTPGVLLLAARHAAKAEIHATKTASLLDLGDGVACLEFRSKMNTVDEGVGTLLAQAMPMLEDKGFRALVIGSQAEHFSAGADARQILGLAQAGKWTELEAVVKAFQDSLMSLRHGSLPVVAAPYGLVLGGGAETVMASTAAVAHAELYMGLVEAGIGLLPAGGGLKEFMRRGSVWASQVDDGDPYPMVRRGFEVSAQAKVSTSAEDARKMGLLGPSDRVVFHNLQVIARAKQLALALADAGYTPPDRNEPITVVGSGRGASLLLGATLFHWGGYASEHDKLIGQKIAYVLSGGMKPPGTQMVAQEILDLEREAFVSLCGEEKTRARIEHTLKTGKPLRN